MREKNDTYSNISSGIFLNLKDALLIGSIIQQNLILAIETISFFCLCADITKMYRQILVYPSQTCMQRILWRDDLSSFINI